MRDYEKYISDISQLTDIPGYQVEYLMKLFRLLVGHEIYECMVDDKKKYESYCVGLGKLKVEYNPDTDDFDVSFKLSKDMNNILHNVLDTQKSPLVDNIDKTLVKQMIDKFHKVIEIE